VFYSLQTVCSCQMLFSTQVCCRVHTPSHLTPPKKNFESTQIPWSNTAGAGWARAHLWLRYCLCYYLLFGIFSIIWNCPIVDIWDTYCNDLLFSLLRARKWPDKILVMRSLVYIDSHKFCICASELTEAAFPADMLFSRSYAGIRRQMSMSCWCMYRAGSLESCVNCL